VTNITLIFETTPHTAGGHGKKWNMAYYIPAVWKSVGTRPLCPSPHCAHDIKYETSRTSSGFNTTSAWYTQYPCPPFPR